MTTTPSSSSSLCVFNTPDYRIYLDLDRHSFSVFDFGDDDAMKLRIAGNWYAYMTNSWWKAANGESEYECNGMLIIMHQSMEEYIFIGQQIIYEFCLPKPEFIHCFTSHSPEAIGLEKPPCALSFTRRYNLTDLNEMNPFIKRML